jgi:ketosteroid isomerase-like protein
VRKPDRFRSPDGLIRRLRILALNFLRRTREPLAAAEHFGYATRLGDHAVKKTAFPTAQDVEAAFYQALETNDLDAMMEVWADDEEVLCIHPNGQRLTGYRQVRDNWAAIFRSGQRIKVHLSDQVQMSGVMFAVHSANENVLVQGEPHARPPVAATNVFLRTGSGWRMIVHHASAVVPPPSRPDAPKVLH